MGDTNTKDSLLDYALMSPRAMHSIREENSNSNTSTVSVDSDEKLERLRQYTALVEADDMEEAKERWRRRWAARKLEFNTGEKIMAAFRTTHSHTPLCSSDCRCDPRNQIDQ